MSFGASLAMTALIVGSGRRMAFSVPIVMALALPAVFGGVPDCYAYDQGTGAHGIGASWSHTAFFEGCGYPPVGSSP